MTDIHRIRPTGFRLVRLGRIAVDGDLVFLVTSVDRSMVAGGPSVPWKRTTAEGIFVNAHLTMTNTCTEPKMFSAAGQKLLVNGIAFTAAAGEVTVLPGACVSVVLSFDVPADTPPWGALELHASPASPGVGVAFPPPDQ